MDRKWQVLISTVWNLSSSVLWKRTCFLSEGGEVSFWLVLEQRTQHMVKLCFVVGLVKGSQNLLNKESSCFCLDLVDFRGWLESDDRFLFWGFLIPSSVFLV